MTAVRRFHQRWERDASKQLRHRDPEAAAVYAENGRLIAVETDSSTEVTVRAWLNDVLAGHDSLIVVDTVSDANRVSMRCQELLAAHELIGHRVGAARDGTPICVGDLIQTRHNTADLATSDDERVLNRDVWRVTGTLHDGTLLATHTRRNATVEIPIGYAAEFVELAYATTIAGAQGRTVDTSHAIVTPRTLAAALYVAMTRGRLRNHAYVVTDSHDHEEFQLGDLNVETAFAAAVTRIPEGQLSATRIGQRWRAGAGRRNDDRAADRARQDALDWWTTRQSVLPPRITKALRRHHSHVLDQLVQRPPASWERTVSAAVALTDWDPAVAGRRFIEQLARTPSHGNTSSTLSHDSKSRTRDR